MPWWLVTVLYHSSSRHEMHSFIAFIAFIAQSLVHRSSFAGASRRWGASTLRAVEPVRADMLDVAVSDRWNTPC